MSNRRVYFLDNLRAFIILYVIAFHAALGYMTYPPEWWHVIDTQKHIVFNLIVLISDVFVMPIMFFIAGFFALPALIKKGTFTFLQEKFNRIIVPWFVGVLLFTPLIVYMRIYTRSQTPPNFVVFLTKDFWGQYFMQAHYWFLGVLAFFFCLLACFYKLNPTVFQQKKHAAYPSMPFVILFGILGAALFFAADIFFDADAWINIKYIFIIQPTRIGLYLSYFALGVYAWQNRWFTAEGYKPEVKWWCMLAVMLSLVFIVYRVMFTFGPNVALLFKAVHGLLHSFFCLTTTFGLLALFQKYVDSKAYFWRRLSDNSYIIYYIHFFILLPLAFAIGKIQTSVWLKFTATTSLSVVLCYLTSEYLVQRLMPKKVSRAKLK